MNAVEWLADRAVLPHAIGTGTRVAAAGGLVVAVDQGPPGRDAVRLHGTLFPGFVDLQVNGAGGRDVAEADDEALDQIARAVLDGGAVAFLPTLITAPWRELLARVAAVAAWVGRWRGDGAEPLGLHVEGPFLETAGAHDATHFVDPTPDRVRELLAAAGGRLRLVTLAPARPGAAEATARLTAADVAVALGHCERTDGFAACVDAGARLVTHLFNAMGALHHRSPGPAALALDDERLCCSLIADGVHVHPAMLRNAFRVLGPGRTVLVTDATAAAGMPDGRYRLGGVDLEAKGGVVRDVAGRLAGSALTMGRAAASFLSLVPAASGWTLAQAAATNPARIAGADPYGAIAPGKRAAFTLLRDDGTFAAVRSP